MSSDRYWGLYSPSRDSWWRSSGGWIIHYPSPEIAKADVQGVQQTVRSDSNYINDWEVREFKPVRKIDRNWLV